MTLAEPAAATVRYDTDGPVARFTIDRYDVRNAVDRPTGAALTAAYGSRVIPCPVGAVRHGSADARDPGGQVSLRSPETIDGVNRFVAGDGRHGS